jgi:AcrR family transcriptional regulator
VQRSSRDQVLDAVGDAVRDLGVRRTTMAEIARRAGLSRSTIYTHFADVRDATAALLTRELLRLLTRVAPPSGPHARDRLVARAVHLAGSVRDDPLVARILSLDAELLVPYLVHRWGSSQRAILDTVVDEIVAGQRDGSIRGGEPTVIATTAFLIAQSFVISAAILDEELGREAALAELRSALQRVLAPADDAPGGVTP